MAKRVSVTYKVIDEFSAAQQKYAAGVKQASDATKDFQRAAGGSGGSSFWRQGAQDLFYMAGAATQVYNSFAQVFSIADQWADMGVSAERNKIALQSLTGVGAEYENQVRSIIDATRGMVTEGEAAGYAYRLQRFGLADTADEMERFMRTVSIVSAINPQLGGTAEAINQIQLTLSNMSFMRLDQLGISAGQVRARMEELGKAQKNLSTDEKFQIAVMEQLDEQANAVGDSILEMTDAQERMKTRWKGFKEWAGLEIAEGFEGIASAAEGAKAAIDEVGVTGLAGALIFGTPNVIEEQRRQNYWSEAQIMGQTGPMEGQRAAGGYGLYNPPVNAQFAQPWHQYAYDYYLRPQAGRFRDASAMPDDLFGTAPNYRTDFGYQSPARITSTPAMDMDSYYSRQRESYYQSSRPGGLGESLGGAWRKGTTEFGDFAGQAQEVIDLLPLMTQGATNFAGVISGVGTDMGAMVDQAQVLADMTLQETWGLGATNFDSSVYSEMTDALQDAGIEGDLAAQAIQAFEINTGMANSSSAIFKDQLDELTVSLQNGEINATEYALAVGDLSRQDFSWADRVAQSMTEAGDLQGAIDYIDALKGMSSGDWQAFDTLGSAMTTGAQNITGFISGKTKDEITQDQGLVSNLSQVDADLDVVLGKISLIQLQGGTDISNFTTAASGDFDVFAQSAGQNLDKIQNNIDSLSGRHISVFMDVIPGIMAGVNSGAPAVPGGGSPNVASNIVDRGIGGVIIHHAHGNIVG